MDDEPLWITRPRPVGWSGTDVGRCCRNPDEAVSCARPKLLRPAQSVATIVAMTNLDTCDELAAISIPLPDSVAVLSGHPEDVLWDARQQAQQERDDLAESLRAAWDGGDHDPVLSAVESAYRAMLAAEQRLHLLVAYAREFVTPRPYGLEQLAQAAGMSISGVRTCYDDDDVRQVQLAISRRPRSGHPATPAARRRSQRVQTAE